MNKIIINVSIRVILIFGIAITYSFLTDYLMSTEFFNDVKSTKEWNYGKQEYITCPEYTIWSIRHWLFFWMNLILFLLQILSLLLYTIKLSNKSE